MIFQAVEVRRSSERPLSWDRCPKPAIPFPTPNKPYVSCAWKDSSRQNWGRGLTVGYWKAIGGKLPFWSA